MYVALKKLMERIAAMKGYEENKNVILGFPSSLPLPETLQALNLTQAFNSNSIQLHFKPKKKEDNNSENSEEKDRERKAFSVFHELEYETLGWITDELLRGDKNKTYGSITTGGTASNIEAFWTARNYFQNNFPDEKIQVVFADEGITHYSIPKALNILGISRTEIKHSKDKNGKDIIIKKEKEINGNVIIRMSANEKGVTEFPNVEIKNIPTLININAPSINTGTIDNLDFLEKIKEKVDEKKIFIHIDGAYGMFVYPFLTEMDFKKIGGAIWNNYKKEKLNQLFFSNPLVKTISIDLHKMGLIPYSCGVFLSQLDNGTGYKNIERTADYISDEFDQTLSGSRSSAVVAAAWIAIKNQKKAGYNKIFTSLLEKTNYLLEFFKKHDKFEIIGNPVINLFAVAFKSENKCCIKEWKSIANKYTIVQSKLSDKRSNIYRFCIMPHVSKENIDNFIKDINQVF